jgi:hypothetical protein
MKRIFPVLVLLIAPLAGFSQSPKITQIVFSTSTRGFSKQVVIRPSRMEIHEENSRVSTGPNNESRKLEKKDWNQLCKQLENISLSEMARWESPTMKRASDAARSSTITITTKDGKIVSHDFDNENPHAKLQPLMDMIIKLAGKEKGR